jgi:hypothetical protein
MKSIRPGQRKPRHGPLAMPALEENAEAAELVMPVLEENAEAAVLVVRDEAVGRELVARE